MCAKNQVNNAFSWQSQPQLVDTLRGRWSFPGVVMSDRPQTVTPIDAVKDGAVSRDIAQQAAVLLKNDNAGLPPDARALHSIAVVGPFAGAAMSGGGGGSSHVLALDTVSPVDGIRNRVGPDVTVTYAPGADAASIPAAVDAAKAADVAVVMVGDNEAEGRDRPSMTLSAPQDDLVAAVAAANPRHQGGTGRHGRLPRRRAPGAAVHRRVRPCAGHSEDEGLRGPRSGIGSGVGSHSCATSRRIPPVPTRLSPRSSSATPTRSSRLAGRPARRSPAGPTCRRRCAAGRSATPGGSSRPTPRPSPPW